MGHAFAMNNPTNYLLAMTPSFRGVKLRGYMGSPRDAVKSRVEFVEDEVDRRS